MIIEVINARMDIVMRDTYVQAAYALRPYVNYYMCTINNIMTYLQKGVETRENV
jgi:hypothetical protein